MYTGSRGLSVLLLHSVYLCPVLFHQRVETASVKRASVSKRLTDLIKIKDYFINRNSID